MAGTVDLRATGTIQRDITFSPTTGGIIGTPTNDNASTGVVGEWIQATAVGTNFPASAAYGDLANISLTAGDWDVTIVFSPYFTTGVTFTQVRYGISTTTGNSGAGLNEGDNMGINTPSTSTDNNYCIPSYRMQLTTTTIVYFKFLGVYTSTAPQASGRISARRMR
jgi:hypothetical protein